MSEYSWFSKPWTRKCPSWASLSPSVQWISVYAKEVIRFGFPTPFSFRGLVCSPSIALTWLSHSSFPCPDRAPFSFTKCPLHVPGPLGYALGPRSETLTQVTPAECPWKKWHCFRGFEGQIGVANTWKGLFLLHPWTLMEDWEVRERKEDGFNLVPLPTGSGES